MYCVYFHHSFFWVWVFTLTGTLRHQVKATMLLGQAQAKHTTVCCFLREEHNRFRVVCGYHIKNDA